MKTLRVLALVLAVVLCTSALTACSSRNVQEELPGEWFVWHWYYNVKDGDNGFFEEAQFYTFGADGKLTIKIGEETSNATYTFSGKDTVEVTYEDGTVDSFQLIPAEHDGVNQIQFMNTNTNYTLTLEPMSSWEDKKTRMGASLFVPISS